MPSVLQDSIEIKKIVYDLELVIGQHLRVGD